MFIPRNSHLKTVEDLLLDYPIVAVLGARQVGKTTLARKLADNWHGQVYMFDLESTEDLMLIQNDPLLTLSELNGLIVLDEIQRLPEVFPTLRVLADRAEHPAKFLILGSASPILLRQSSESLAGRIAYHELTGFSVSEISIEHLDKLWLRGGFPQSFTAKSDAKSIQWRRNFIRSFVERDAFQFGMDFNRVLLERLWQMLVHYHGRIVNESELARALGITRPTVHRYLNLLEATFLIRRLKPWSSNIKKRQVKAPKVYIRDSGLVNCLIDAASRDDLLLHPKIGASWEGFLLESLIQILELEERHCYFWATHSGAEIDFIVYKGGILRGFEIKRTSSPKTTPSMQNALDDLNLKEIDVIHAGSRTYPLKKGIRAVAANRILEDIQLF